jgi:hypothetical protein
LSHKEIKGGTRKEGIKRGRSDGRKEEGVKTCWKAVRKDGIVVLKKARRKVLRLQGIKEEKRVGGKEGRYVGSTFR